MTKKHFEQVELTKNRRTTFVRGSDEILIDDAQIRVRKSVTSNRLAISEIVRDERGKIEIVSNSVKNLRLSTSEKFGFDSAECRLIQLRIRPFFYRWHQLFKKRSFDRDLVNLGKVRASTNAFTRWRQHYDISQPQPLVVANTANTDFKTGLGEINHCQAEQSQSESAVKVVVEDQSIIKPCEGIAEEIKAKHTSGVVAMLFEDQRPAHAPLC